MLSIGGFAATISGSCLRSTSGDSLTTGEETSPFIFLSLIGVIVEVAGGFAIFGLSDLTLNFGTCLLSSSCFAI